MAFQLPNVFTSGSALKLNGPVTQGFATHPVAKESMVYFRCRVPNGSVYPKPLPFGVFAEITPDNTADALLEVWVAPSYYTGTPVFAVRSEAISDPNPWACGGTRTSQIVATGTAKDESSTIWESNVRYIDETHSEKVNIVLGTLKDVKRTQFDENLKAWLEITETLMYETAAEADLDFPGTLKDDGGPGPYYFTEFNKVKACWYVKKRTKLTTAMGETYETTENYSLPAVLDYVDFTALDALDEFGESYRYKVLVDAVIKGAYSGPCKTVVVTGWSPVSVGADGLTSLHPKSIDFVGPTFGFSISPCLHEADTIVDNVNADHPVFDGAVNRSVTYNPTKKYIVGTGESNQTDWPSTIIKFKGEVPYLGGYLTTTKTVHVPVITDSP